MTRALSVLFASQTGNAMKIAKALVEEAETHGLTPSLLCLNKWEEAQWNSQTPVVIVASSFGMGEAPVNGKKFESMLKSKTLAWRIDGVRFAVLGIGNSMYPKFCGFTNFVDRKLEEIGGVRICPRLDGDDKNVKQRCENVKKWCAELFQLLAPPKEEPKPLPSPMAIEEAKDIEELASPHTLSMLAIPKRMSVDLTYTSPKEGAKSPRKSRSTSCSICLVKCASATSMPCIEAAASTDPFSGGLFENCVEAELLSAKYLTSSCSSRRVVHVELSSPGLGKMYSPGDSIGVPCRNSDAVVDALLERLGLNPRQSFEIAGASSSSEVSELYRHLPKRGTARYILTNCVDVCSAPTIELLEALAEFSEGSDAEELRWLSSSEDVLMRFISKHPTLLEILNQFKTCDPPLDVLLEVLRPLAPRFYSIGSSPAKHGDVIHIAFSVVERHIDEKRVFRGLCTSWLEDLVRPMLEDSAKDGSDKCHSAIEGSELSSISEGTIEIMGKASSKVRVPVFVRATPDLRFLDYGLKKSVLLIGPGTGCVPFRSYLHHLDATPPSPTSAIKPRRWLLVGHRHKELDFLYNEDWLKLQQKGIIDEVLAAFSRDPSAKWTYVQDALLDRKDAVWRLLSEEGGVVFVCGSMAVAQGIERVLRVIACECGGLPVSAADDFVRKLYAEGRLVTEVWG